MTELAQLALRAALAVVFVAHGAQKLLGWWGGGLESTTQLFQALGLEPAHVLAIVCGVVELGAGIMLAVGLLTRRPPSPSSSTCASRWRTRPGLTASSPTRAVSS